MTKCAARNPSARRTRNYTAYLSVEARIIGDRTPGVNPSQRPARASDAARAPLALRNYLARAAIGMHGSVAYWLIDDDVAVADLDIVEAVRIRADPCLELD